MTSFIDRRVAILRRRAGLTPAAALRFIRRSFWLGTLRGGRYVSEADVITERRAIVREAVASLAARRRRS